MTQSLAAARAQLEFDRGFAALHTDEVAVILHSLQAISTQRNAVALSSHFEPEGVQLFFTDA